MRKEEFKNLSIFCNLALLLTAFISGLSFVAQKLGMLYIEPFTFNTLRCFIGSLVLIPVFYILKPFFFNKEPEFKNINLIKGGISTGILLFIALSINQYCMIYANAGKAGFITSLYIIFVPIIAIFLKQKLKQNVKLGIIFALIGLYLLCAKDFTGFEKWDILLLLSAFFFALHIMTVSYFTRKANTIKLAILQFLTAGTLSLIPMILTETPKLSAIILGWEPILFIGIIVTGLAYTLQILGQKAAKPVIAGIILSSESIFAVLGGMLILHETFSGREIIGSLIMLIGIIISQIPNKLTGGGIKNEKQN